MRGHTDAATILALVRLVCPQFEAEAAGTPHPRFGASGRTFAVDGGANLDGALSTSASTVAIGGHAVTLKATITVAPPNTGTPSGGNAAGADGIDAA
jgi:hypothetical protein